MNNALLAQFLPEARDLIQSAERGLLRLEDTPGDAAVINEIFRAIHTLKGSSGLFDVLALTKLMHAAEDLLSAVRAGQFALDSELVDQLLISLDEVEHWIDYLELHEGLPEHADRIATALVAELRRHLPNQPAPAGGPAVPGAVADAASLAAFSQQEKLAAFDAILAGERIVTVVRYEPDENCFFSGEDPLALVGQIDGLVALCIVPRSPWPPLAELDPYRCNLIFKILCSVDEPALTHLFRYVADQVRMAPVQAAQIVRSAEFDIDAVAEDFVADARAILGSGNLAAMQALLDEAGLDKDAASCVPWLRSALAAPKPDSILLAAILQRAAAAHGHHDTGTTAAPTSAHANQHMAMSRILAAQEQILRLPGLSEKRLASVGTILQQIAAKLSADAESGLRPALTAALADGTADAVLSVLASMHAAIPLGPPERADGGPPQASPQERAKAGPAEAGAVAQKALKVDPAKVDLLMNLIGELVVAKNALPFLAKKAEDGRDARALASEIKDHYAVIDRLTQEMQRAIMQVRMLPISEVFARFPRLIRDIARKLGKKVQLVIEGEDTAAEKTIIEALGDPLLHIVRNAIDHGIEEPDERVRSGKPGEARILLRASQEADGIVIEVSDDGRGIDPAKIRSIAGAKGLMEADALALLSDQQAIDLIFAAGFSTKAEISDLSGRGVGMDVVRSAAAGLGGRATIASQLGRGTQVRLFLPLTMAVTRVIVVKAGDSFFGVPMDLAVETVRLPAGQIVAIKNAEAFVLRNNVVPLVRASKLLRDGSSCGLKPEEAVLVCRVDGSTIGLIIDDFCESMDVILKPLDGLLAEIPGYSGTALLGDGNILLILNLKELLDAASV